MKNTYDWIAKHKILIIVIMVIAFFLPLIVVNLLFKWKSGIPFIEAEWSAGELLTYISGAETLLGTLFLGYITIRQTEKIELEKRLVEWKPDINITKVETDSSIYCEQKEFVLVKGDITLKKKTVQSLKDVKYKNIELTCENINGIKLNKITVVSKDCYIYYDNGRRNGESLVKNLICDIGFDNMANLEILSDSTKSLRYHDNKNFTFVIRIICDASVNFDHDANDLIESIYRNRYGLRLDLKFVNSENIAEESIFDICRIGEEIKVTKYKGKCYYNTEDDIND